jgi:UPF0176 protein
LAHGLNLKATWDSPLIMDYKVITFYKYVEIANAEILKEELRAFCEKNNILGRILIGEEGINGAASARNDEIELLKSRLRKDRRFSDLTFREYGCEKNAYHKLVIRVRKETVAFGEKVDLRNKGKYVTPKELKQLYDRKEDFVMIDARNDYEYKVGHFDDAVELPMKSFRELPQKLDRIKGYKDKKVVMYCTGGIRCEKASAFLKEQGFKDVSHLKGGIIEFNHEFPGTNFKGANFVFDDRLVDSEELLLDCKICGKEASNYTNCHNLDCDNLFACCKSCRENLKNCCSERCMNSKRQRKRNKNCRKIGRVLNYFEKAKVAHIMLDDSIKKGERIGFFGKTTKEFFVTAESIRDEDDKEMASASQGQSVTIPLKDKVRKNDIVFV